MVFGPSGTGKMDCGVEDVSGGQSGRAAVALPLVATNLPTNGAEQAGSVRA